MEDTLKETRKEVLAANFPTFTDSQVDKLMAAYYAISWVNNTMDITMFIRILKNDRYKNPYMDSKK